MKAPTKIAKFARDGRKPGCDPCTLWIAVAVIILALTAVEFQVVKNLRNKRYREIAEAAAGLVESGDAFQARRLLAEAVPDKVWKDLRNEPELAWSLYRSMNAEEGRIHVPEPLSAMAVSGSGTILTLSYSGYPRKVILREWNLDTGLPIKEFSQETLPTLENAYESVFAFSPDGSRLLSERGVLFDTDGFLELFELEDGPHLLSAMSFSPDGKAIAAREYGNLSVWDARTGRRVLTVKNAFVYKRDILREYSILFSSDNERLAFTPAPGGVGILQIGAHKVTIIPATDSVKLWSTKQPMQGKVPEGSRLLGFSGDGSRLLTQDKGNGIRAWDIASGEQADVLDSEVDALIRPAWNEPVRQIDEKTISVQLTSAEPAPVMIHPDGKNETWSGDLPDFQALSRELLDIYGNR